MSNLQSSTSCNRNRNQVVTTPARNGEQGDSEELIIECSGIVVLQANLQNCRAATALASQISHDYRASILLLQEPHTTDGKITGFSNSWYTMLDTSKKAAIAFRGTGKPPLLIKKGEHFITASIVTDIGNIYFTSLYVSPSTDLEPTLRDMELSDLLNHPTIIGGDFNAKSPQWGGPVQDGRGTIVINFAATNWLTPINSTNTPPTCVTCRGGGWPDITLSSLDLAHHIDNWKVESTETLSDHRHITFRIAAKIIHPTTTRRFKTKYGGHLKLKTILEQDKDSLLNQLALVTTTNGLDIYAESLLNTIINACHKCYKLKGSKAAQKASWWTPTLQAEQRKLKALRRRLTRNQDPVLRTPLLLNLKRCTAIYKKQIRVARQESWRSFCSAATNKFGTEFKLAYGKFSSPQLLQRPVSSQVTNHDDARARIIEGLFPESTACAMQNRNSDQESSAPPLSIGEVNYAVSSLNSRKAPGPDRIDGFIVKAIHSHHPRLLFSFFEACIRLKHFPKALKVADVVLIEKKINTNNSKCYRPICLLPLLGKILEKIISQRILHHLDNNSPLDPKQHGFRRGFSTETALQMLLEKIHSLKIQNSLVSMVSFDIQGAFDRVQWPIIISSLQAKGVPEYLITIMSSYLNDRFVLLSNAKKHKVTMGCPQGSCLGPILWNLVADSALQLNWPPNVHIQAYADDFALLIGSHSRRTLESLANTAITKFNDWCLQSQLNISFSKTSAITFSKHRREPIFKLDGNTIPMKRTIKYLGVVLDKNLTWLPHIASAKEKAMKVSSFLLRMAAKTWGITSKLLRTWYQAVPEKIILYACAVWFPQLKVHGKRALISGQRPFLLQISRAARNTSNNALCILTNLPPIDLLAAKLADQGRFARLGQDLPGHKRLDYVTYSFSVTTHPAIEDLPHIFTHPNSSSITKIFTDGSKHSGKVGSAFVAYPHMGELHTWKARLGDNNSVFQAELLAIQKAVDWSQQYQHDVWIQTDSASSISALQHVRHTDPYVITLKSSLRESKVPIYITWVKAHAGEEGNEAADEAAKEAATLPTPGTCSPKLPLSHLRHSLKAIMLSDWQDRWTTTDKGRDLWPFISKVKDAQIVTDRHLVAFFSGHGPFPAVLHRHGLCEDPRCVCGHLGTPIHYISECPLTTAYHLKKPPASSLQDWCGFLYNNYYAHKAIRNLCIYLRENELNLRYNDP